MTEEAFGREGRVTPTVIGRFLTRERGLHIDSLDRIAEVLGLQLTEGTRARGRPKRRG